MVREIASAASHLAKLSHKERDAFFTTITECEAGDLRHLDLATTALRSIPASKREAAIELLKEEYAEQVAKTKKKG